jgi:hypothetical protein
MLNPKVTIIVPCFEQESLAFQAVRSALRQDYPNLEVVFVDDASPVARYEAVWAISDPRLRKFRNPRNLGRVGNYRHALYSLATGDWVLVLDGDDILIDPSFISRAVVVGERDPSIVIVAGRCLTASRHGEMLSSIPGEVAMDGLDLLTHLPRPDLHFMHLATLYRRSPAMAEDFYRVPHISSDWESLYRLAAKGRVAFVDVVAGVWRIHGHNASGSSDPVTLANNLSIWSSIYASAVRAGMSAATAKSARLRCQTFAIRQHLPSLFRGPRSAARLATYVRLAAAESRQAVLAALLSPLPLARIAMGFVGYYRGRAF